MMRQQQTHDAVGATLEEAIRKAHAAIPTRPHRDFTLSQTIDWGMQSGGFVGQTVFWVSIVEDPDGPFKA